MSKRRANSKLKLKSAELEQISAYLDGELPQDQAERTAEHIRRDANWTKAAKTFEAVDSLLENWQAAPLRRDLTQSILAEAHRKPARPAWLKVAAPLAAAAAILLIVTLSTAISLRGSSGGMMAKATPHVRLPEGAARAIASVPDEDKFVVENLDVIENLDVLANYDTLEAMDRLASNAGAM